jgi:two-component system response regulator
MRTILLVDDDEDYLDIAQRAIEREHLGADVNVARSGPEALEKLGLGPGRAASQATAPTNELAALFVDLNLPGVDGWEVLRRVRADARLHRLPVVVVSSSSRPEDVTRSYDLGANSYVVKQFDASGPGRYLARAMRYWLDLNRAAGPAPRMPR